MSVSTDLDVAPGSIIQVRDEEWLVTSVDSTADGQLLQVTGTSELVRGTTANFYPSIDRVVPLNPADARVIADASPHYRKARLWLESTIRKTATPANLPDMVVSDGALADPLPYQHTAVEKALDPNHLRTRILLADAVGLGKTLEIGMILSELIRRGRGERILIVCPRHVLEQTQNEMWSRFDIPFVRLDSLGVQRVKQKIPANRNPFTFYKRVIISIDTLKQDRFAGDLRKHHWDIVVIDESHNVTNSSSKNNSLARVLAPNTDAMILASATPHNGKKESFAELIRLLEPTAVSPAGDLNPDDLKSLVVRRHRNSDEVASVVGADWAERLPPNNVLVDASPAENAVADELATTWLHPTCGISPYSGATIGLFPWTLAKAYLSSPAALEETIDNRLRGLTSAEPTQAREIAALTRLRELNQLSFDHSAKYHKLVHYLRSIGVAKNSPERAVVFSERVPTLGWLRTKFTHDLKLKPEQVAILHGGMTDLDQQNIVESFKQASSPIRLLITGDVASEGVNLHLQCHELIHYDIPWSLIRIEQRNGRIDRYGQRHRPQITTLLLNPSTEDWTGDIHVLQLLLQKEQQAHQALGDAASLMGEYSATAEENAIRDVLAHRKNFDDVVKDPADLTGDPDDSLAAFLDLIGSDSVEATSTERKPPSRDPLYPKAVDFLREAVEDYYQGNQSKAPGDAGAGGISWKEFPAEHLVEFVPPADLRARLEVLPDSYLRQRHVLQRIKLATTKSEADRLLKNALNDENGSSWPEAHYLGPLHPVLDWAADRCLAALSRNEIFAVRGAVQHPNVLTVGTITNKRGQVISAVWMSVMFNPDDFFVSPVIHDSSFAMFRAMGLDGDLNNPGPVAGIDDLQELISRAVRKAADYLEYVGQASMDDTQHRVQAWNQQIETWSAQAAQLPLIGSMKRRRMAVEQERELIAQMSPDRRLVRPLLVVVPANTPVEGGN